MGYVFQDRFFGQVLWGTFCEGVFWNKVLVGTLFGIAFGGKDSWGMF